MKTPEQFFKDNYPLYERMGLGMVDKQEVFSMMNEYSKYLLVKVSELEVDRDERIQLQIEKNKYINQLKGKIKQLEAERSDLLTKVSELQSENERIKKDGKVIKTPEQFIIRMENQNENRNSKT